MGQGGLSNKDRYYKTGTYFWQSLHDVYGAEVLKTVFRRMHVEPREDLPVFPFSSATNDLLIRTYFLPIMEPEVWALVERYGIVPMP